MSPPRLPARLVLIGIADHAPLVGAFFELELPMAAKNNYKVPVGPADGNGELTITDAELRASMGRINDLFPMDYVGIDAGWMGEILIRPVDRRVLARLRQAYATWRETGYYPAGFDDQLDALDRRLATLPSDATMEVVVDAASANSAVRVHSSSVGGS